MTTTISRTPMLPGQKTPTRILVAALLASASACNDSTAPVAKLPNGAALAAGNEKVKVKNVRFSSNTLKINSPPVEVDVTLNNSGLAIQSGVTLRAEIVQGEASRQAMLPRATQCLPGDPVGFLPNGNCDMSIQAFAANTVPGTGTLMAGLASFVIHVDQNINGVVTEIANKSVGITLVDKPTITSLTLAATTLAINGPGTTYTGTLLNPAGTLQDVLLQGLIVQGTTERAAGGFMVSCGAPLGNLPNGTCSFSFTASASNSAGGTGTLIPGAAQFKLQLIQADGTTSTTFDQRIVPITLVQVASITSINPSSTFIVLGSGFTSMTATLENNGGSLTEVSIQGWISQPSGARRAAGGTLTRCPGYAGGELPTGTCTAPGDIVAMPGDPASGTGTLVLGPATYELELRQFVGGVAVILDTKTIPITLTAAP